MVRIIKCEFHETRTKCETEDVVYQNGVIVIGGTSDYTTVVIHLTADGDLTEVYGDYDTVIKTLERDYGKELAEKINKLLQEE
jgi:hypothetical protein